MRTEQQEMMATESFERWFLQRVAQAVEREDLSAHFLVELQTEIATGRVRTPDAGPLAALQWIVDLLEVDQTTAQDALMAQACHSEADRERLLREVAEGWLSDQTERYRRQPRL